MAEPIPAERSPQSDSTPPSIAALRARRDDVYAAARRHGIRRIVVYGSVARGRAGPGSDLDLLVEPMPGRSLLDIVDLRLELERMLGCRVEIGTRMRPELAGELRDAVPL